MPRGKPKIFATLLGATCLVIGACLPSRAAGTPEELLSSAAEPGRRGGRLVVALRAEPKTLNPVLALDNPSRQVIWRIMADLVHINRLSQQTGPALAKSWSVSRDGLRYTLRLRRGVRFSDGHPFDADDVLFSFQVYLDEKVRSPQRDLLLPGGKPVTVRKVDSHTVVFELAKPYAAAERLFDSIAILPRHLLQKAYQEGKFAEAWTLTTPPGAIAGLGPFRLKEYAPGSRLVLERNPHYWKQDRNLNRLPYLDELVFLFVANEDAEVIRFQAGETDLVSRLSAENFSVLARAPQASGFELRDLGPALEYNFLFYNLNDVSSKNLPQIGRKQAWFREVKFRQAISSAIDRAGMIRLVYQGRATPLGAHVTPGNRVWVHDRLPPPQRSLERARQLLRESGFTWNSDGRLVDARGELVEFTIVTNASNTQRVQMATIAQQDLEQLGMQVHVVPLEFRAVLDRLFKTYDYEACLLGLGSGDADPNAEMNVWLSGGSTHVWQLGAGGPATPWEAEMDRLMREQQTTLDKRRRKRLYDRVQELVAENLPLICLVSPNLLVGAKNGLANFQPAILDPHTLWNVEEIFWRHKETLARR